MQTHSKRERQRQKSLVRRRIITAIIAVLFFAVGTTIWILNSQGIGIVQGHWAPIISIIFTVLSVAIPFFQGLFHISSKDTQHSQVPLSSSSPSPGIAQDPLSKPTDSDSHFTNKQNYRKDFLITYTEADHLWADWIVYQLEDAGYSIVLQTSELWSESKIVQEMDRIAKEIRAIIVVLSPNYLNVLYNQPTWTTVFRNLTYENITTLAIRIHPCDSKELLGEIILTDLVGLDERKARETLLVAINHMHDKLGDTPSLPVKTRVLKAEQPRFPGTLPITWNVPYPRNPFFTNREDDLKNLHEALRGDKAAVLTQPRAISGLGGIGKTQTAIEYTYRYHNEYQAILWMKADSYETLVSDFVNIASLLKLPEKDVPDQKIAVNAVKRWLQEHTDWLLIFDNTEDLSTVRDFIPSGKGHTMLTTRTQATGAIAKPIELEKLEMEEGALFLLRRANIIAPEAQLNDVSKDDRAKAREISQVMDGLPLALDQAGAYIEETKCSLSDYLELYQTRRLALLKLRGGTAFDHPESVTTTWSLSFMKVEQESPAAAELLRLCSFLYADAIPDEIIIEGSSDLGSVLQPIAADPFKLNMTIKELLKYSLVRRDSSTKTLTIHRLVQAVLKDQMNEGTQRQWAERTVRAVNRAFPDVEFTLWQNGQRCLPHAQVCAALIEQWKIVSTDAARLLNQAGWYLEERAQYAQAEELLRQGLTLREHLLGSEHPDVATTLNNLGLLYYNQGKYAEAEPLYKRALEIREKTLGLEHPDVATILNNLGSLYSDQGKYAEAEPLYRRALEIREKTLEPERPDSLNNLAWLYYNQGKYTQAEVLYKQALNIYERTLGFEHPKVATILNNLGLLYYNESEYSKAEPLYKQALEIREKTLGLEHPDVAITLNNLAWLYHNQGRYIEAEPLYQRALTIQETILGQEHPNIAQILNAQAMLNRALGKYSQAEQLFKRALAIREHLLGQDHPFVATTLNDLAWLYFDRGKYAEAEALYLKALVIREKALGQEHPHLATTLNDLAVLYVEQGKYLQAEQLFQRALNIREKALGPDHPRLAATLNNLGFLYYNQGRYSEAEALYKRALDIRQKILGQEHPYIAQSFNGLADIYRAQGEYSQAQQLYQQALGIQEKVLGPNHRHTATTLNNLAGLYVDQGKYSQAQQLYQQALAIREKAMNPEHPHVAQSLNDLAKLYFNQGKYAQAESLYQRALAIDEKAFGLMHPYIASIFENYAVLLRKTKRQTQAAELEANARLIRAKYAQENHPQ